MSRPENNFLWLLLLAFLCGCAHLPDTRSARHKQAMDWANQGERAYVAGDLEQSRRCYENALRLNSSIENAHGIASDTLSLAQISLDRGEYGRARARLRFVIDDRNKLFSAADRAGAAARYAQLELLLKQPAKAAEQAQQAEVLCGECPLSAAILNLQAQASMALGKDNAGLDLARRAAATADRAKQPVELANARRLQGEILLRRKAAAGAIGPLALALALDKQQGLAARIAEDLHLLAEAQDGLGRHDAAQSLRSREQAVRAALEEKGQ